MSRRRKQRELAIQLVYAMDLTGDKFEDARYRFTQVDPARRKAWGKFAERLASQCEAHREEIDEKLSNALKNWRMERLAAIDRAMLRLAICELICFEDIPIRVTINEYIELARDFGNDESPAFINGVLDAVAREFPEKDFQVGKTDSAAESTEGK